MVYSRIVEGKTLTFGISGRRYQSNVLLYDHQSETLWSQLMEKAIAGPKVGKSLSKIVSHRVKWKKWKKMQPDTYVLSANTGYKRNYSIDPYAGYYNLGRLMFPVGNVRKDLPTKERVLGLEIEGISKAYPLSKIIVKPGEFVDEIGGKSIRIRVSQDREVEAVLDDKGRSLPVIYSYWFAWQSFHPETKVYK